MTQNVNTWMGRNTRSRDQITVSHSKTVCCWQERKMRLRTFKCRYRCGQCTSTFVFCHDKAAQFYSAALLNRKKCQIGQTFVTSFRVEPHAPNNGPISRVILDQHGPLCFPGINSYAAGISCYLCLETDMQRTLSNLLYRGKVLNGEE